MVQLKKKIVLIGSINITGLPSGGEEYKNQLLTQLFQQDDFFLSIVDTHHWMRRPVVFLQLFYYILLSKSDNIVISASSDSVYKLLTTIKFIRPRKLESIIYFVLGGFLPGALIKKQYSLTVYQRLQWIIVQGKQMKEALNSLDLSNIEVIPNFKNTKIFLKTIGNNYVKSRKLIFISTICEEKGVDLIFEAISLMNEGDTQSNYFEVDFYGLIDNSYKKSFLEKLTLFSKQVRYCGYLDIMNNPLRSYRIMEEYEAMVFPTLYEGEGFPGIFIDAFICGLPIVTTDWHMNREIIENRINGIILEKNNAKSLLKGILEILDSRELSTFISHNNKKLADEFEMLDIYKSKIQPLLAK